MHYFVNNKVKVKKNKKRKKLLTGHTIPRDKYSVTCPFIQVRVGSFMDAKLTPVPTASGRKSGARVLILHDYLHLGKGRLMLAVSRLLAGDHLTDLKIWRTARSEMSKLPRFQVEKNENMKTEVVSYNEL
jgi:hypothetical protein